MRGLVVLSTVLFGGSSLCGGMPAVLDDLVGEDVVDEASCCQYADEDGVARFEILESSEECEEQHGDASGQWVADAQCAECCCKTVGRPELITAAECGFDVGQCVTDEACDFPDLKPKHKRGSKPRRGQRSSDDDDDD